MKENSNIIFLFIQISSYTRTSCTYIAADSYKYPWNQRCT